MLKQQVFEICKVAAPNYLIDPKLVLAICEQESSYFDDQARLENGFFHRYTLKLGLATTNAVLLATSYGLMQTMGESLNEMSYFQWYQKYYNDHNTFQLTDPLSEIAIPKGLNAFMVRPIWQIEWGCKWFKGKLDKSAGDTTKALLSWNGGGDPQYADKVLTRFERLKKESLN